MKSTLRGPAMLPWAMPRLALSDRIRPGIESAGLAVGLDVIGVELGGVVVGRGERLLHHHRRQTTLLVARLVAHVPDRMADFVVAHVLPVGADAAFKRDGSTHPARLVDENPRLPVRSVHRV